MIDIEKQAVEKIEALCDGIEPMTLERIEPGFHRSGCWIDMLIHVRVFDLVHVLVCGVNPNGQPRYVRPSAIQLRDCAAQMGDEASPVLMAPYLSPASQALCREYGVGFLDFQDNAYLALERALIVRDRGGPPPAERRKLKSLFKPKAARILLTMLRDPGREWRMSELAEAAEVSLGHASNVRTALLDREWAGIGPNGMFLVKPGSLLHTWRGKYEPPADKRFRFYTPLHGREFDEATRRVLGDRSGAARAVLASFSAANWLAPYARTGSSYFYADLAGLEQLKERLRLCPAAMGENVDVTIPKDTWVLKDIVEPAPDVVCTGVVRTYLDLSATGERGREAADHLFGGRLRSWA